MTVMPRRADVIVGLIGATLGVFGVAVEGGGAGLGVAAAVLGGALCLSRPYPPAACVLACGAMLVLALRTQELMVGFVLLLLVMAHVFAAGRWGGNWWGVGGLVAFTGSLLAAAWITGEAAMPASWCR